MLFFFVVDSSPQGTDCVIKEINWEKKFSGITPVSNDQAPNPFSHTRTDGGAPRVYENVGFTKDNEGAANPTVDQQNQDVSSRIYLTLQPSAQRTADSRTTLRLHRGESRINLV